MINWPGWILAGVALLSFLFGGGLVAAWMLWSLRQMVRQVVSHELTPHLETLSTLENRLVALEAEVEHVPTKADLMKVTEKLAQIAGRLEILARVEQQVHRIETHLLTVK